MREFHYGHLTPPIRTVVPDIFGPPSWPVEQEPGVPHHAVFWEPRCSRVRRDSEYGNRPFLKIRASNPNLTQDEQLEGAKITESCSDLALELERAFIPWRGS
jgi:hypothetical protein